MTGLAMAGRVVAWWTPLFLLYLILIGPISWSELAVGAGAAALATWGAIALVRTARPGWGGVGRLPAALAAWPAALLQDTWRLARLTAAAALRRPGHADPGADPGADLGAIRSHPAAGAPWAAALLSSTPGVCVLDIREDSRAPARPAVLRVHRLRGATSRTQRLITDHESR